MTTPVRGTPVVLYACTTSHGDPTSILAELRRYAAARRWTVVAEHADCTGAAPAHQRPGWLRARQLIQNGQARALVTRYPAMAAYIDAERAALPGWLDEHGATAHYTWRTPPAAVPTA